MKANFFLLGLSVFLCACGSVNPVTLLKVSQLSPLEADPEVMAVEIDLPPGLGVPKDSAVITFFSTRSDTGDAIEETFVLQVLEQKIYRFAPSDLDRLRATQATIRTWEAEAPRANSGGISVNVGACRVGDGPAPDARGSLRVRIDESGSFYPLVSNGLLSAVFGDQDVSTFPICEGPS